MRNWVVLKTLPSGVGLDSTVIGPTCQQCFAGELIPRQRHGISEDVCK